MLNKIVFIVFFLSLVLIQYKIWFNPQGLSETLELKKFIHKQETINAQEQQKNVNLKKSIDKFKQNNSDVEDRARNDLGMIKQGETFYQVIQ